MKTTFFLAFLLFSVVVFADCEDKINKVKDGDSIKEAMNCLNKLQLDQAVKIESLPAKAVVAFNSETCPSGWKALKNGEGRVIVGAGRGDGLSARVLGDFGGAETHTLTIAEIPSHSHPHTDDGVYHNPPNKYEGLSTEFRGNSSVGLTHGTNITAVTGGGQPHNIMQPFIVLKLCEKM